ncbi:MAG: rhodanese-like domain-containing protein [Acidobacteria bacterium]|nr:rhodanese-like domain-containing protein [Acidobacteriota bacterium]
MTALTASTMVAEAKGRVENLTPEETAQELERGALVVDIREEDELRRDGRIPGAVISPRGMLEFWVDPTSPYHREEFQPDRRIVLYCASGGRSALAADTMQRMGYSQVAHMDGGLKAWKEQGRPVEHET